MEIWKDINGYEEIYQVSNYGNVRSKTHVRVNGKNKNHICVSIGKCCKYKVKSAYGYIWRYSNESSLQKE